MNTQPQTTTEQTTINTVNVDSFATLVKCGINSWVAAGQMLVMLVDSNPNVYHEIAKRHPFMTLDMLIGFEKIGRKQIYPYLLFDKRPACKYLIPMPYEDQERIYNGIIEVVSEIEGEKPIISKKRFHDLSKAESSIVFSSSGVRSVDEQCKVLNGFSFPKRRRTKEIEIKPKRKSLGFYRIVLRFGKAEMVKLPVADNEAQKIQIGHVITDKAATVELFEIVD